MAGNIRREGGFNLPLAMEAIYKDNVDADSRFPVIIAVSDNIRRAPPFDRGDLIKRFPESAYYYNLGYDLSLTPYSLQNNGRLDIVQSPIIGKALTYGGYAVADGETGEIVSDLNFDGYTDNAYLNALILYGKGFSSDESIHGAHYAQTELIRDSFRQRILTKHTAFTVLETAEQERALLELQTKFLNGSSYDAPPGAPAVRMDEPGFQTIALALAALAIIYFMKKRLHVFNRGTYDVGYVPRGLLPEFRRFHK
jgi:hypothetical protein